MYILNWKTFVTEFNYLFFVSNPSQTKINIIQINIIIRNFGTYAHIEYSQYKIDF